MLFKRMPNAEQKWSDRACISNGRQKGQRGRNKKRIRRGGQKLNQLSLFLSRVLSEKERNAWPSFPPPAVALFLTAERGSGFLYYTSASTFRSAGRHALYAYIPSGRCHASPKADTRAHYYDKVDCGI